MAHTHKIQLHQHLSDDIPDCWIQLCEWVTQKIAEDHTFPSQIMFSDEADYYMNGEWTVRTTATGVTATLTGWTSSRFRVLRKSWCGVDYEAHKLLGRYLLIGIWMPTNTWTCSKKLLFHLFWMNNVISQFTSNKMGHLPTTLWKFENG
jgi:hypothetical protein